MIPIETKPVWKKRETILVVIKDISELTVIPLVTAVQSYADDAKRKHEGFCSYRKALSDYEVQIDLMLPSFEAQQFAFLFTTLIPSVKNISYLHMTQIEVSHYDCIFDLSEAKAKLIGAQTGRSLNQSYGVMLGGEAFTFPRNVENLCPVFTPSGKILMSFEMLKLLPSRVFAHLPETLFVMRDEADLALIMGLPRNLSISDRVKQVFECEGVIDVASFETHLASALYKPVLELNNDPTLTKWSNPNYYLITEMTQDGFTKGVKQCFSALVDG